MTSWNTGVLAKMIINKTKGVAHLLYPTTLLKCCQFANDFLKLPMTSWSTGVLAKRIIKENKNSAAIQRSHFSLISLSRMKNLRITTVTSKQTKKTASNIKKQQLVYCHDEKSKKKSNCYLTTHCNANKEVANLQLLCLSFVSIAYSIMPLLFLMLTQYVPNT